jgi:cellulose biosynthesis protein BcsQ
LASALAVGNEEFGITGRRVLLIDLDPKGNIATTFGIDKKKLGSTMNDLFKAGIDGPSFFLSIPKVVAIFPFGSRSINSTLRPAMPNSSFPTASAEAKFTAVVVLPQPPL